MKLYTLSGYASLLLGTVCCVLLISPALLPFSLLCCILGYACATINIYLNAKYEFTKGNFSVGYIGMLLSSAPVVFVLILIFKQ